MTERHAIEGVSCRESRQRVGFGRLQRSVKRKPSGLRLTHWPKVRLRLLPLNHPSSISACRFRHLIVKLSYIDHAVTRRAITSDSPYTIPTISLRLSPSLSTDNALPHRRLDWPTPSLSPTCLSRPLSRLSTQSSRLPPLVTLSRSALLLPLLLLLHHVPPLRRPSPQTSSANARTSHKMPHIPNPPTRAQAEKS